MIIACPGCGSSYKLDPTKAKKKQVRIKCPGCHHLFAIELPAGPAAAERPKAAEGPAPAEPPPKVLVVDDSKFFRELIIDVLGPLSLTLLTAGDGVEALRLIRSERPVLVLLDLNLPEMNGYDLVREVRSDVSLRGIRLLAMSGVFRKDEDATEVKQAGADDFINKSFKPEELQRRVTALLKG